MDWRESKLSFDSKSKLISAVKLVDFEQVNRLYQSLVSADGFGRVMVQMRGTKFKNEAFVEFKSQESNKVEQVTNIDEFHAEQIK